MWPKVQRLILFYICQKWVELPHFSPGGKFWGRADARRPDVPLLLLNLLLNAWHYFSPLAHIEDKSAAKTAADETPLWLKGHHLWWFRLDLNKICLKTRCSCLSRKSWFGGGHRSLQTLKLWCPQYLHRKDKRKKKSWTSDDDSVLQPLWAQDESSYHISLLLNLFWM